MNNENGVVGDIKIRQPKKKVKNKKNKDNSTPFAVKIFVWFMFVAMLASFAVPLIFYLVSVISAS